ncbi:hypothetical protein [Desulfotomaculum copahuensis]|uniref:Uncharacterized protein n=1 Tax=Desulfotomaculum copahuensis TaxID=1838280 RepID=A0A1B7LDM4_9FIRM|nr:hypothetical protein [Desulfotomaculum copahuensis]OAT81190.1 hypothetical protein A6M21_11690 [Desulfotomaculum copahuensis]
MENARALEDRLKGIIREISGQTGREIKKDLLAGLARDVTTIVQNNTRQELTRTLNLLKETLKQM